MRFTALATRSAVLVSLAAGAVVAGFAWMAPATVRADTPAVTDFGGAQWRQAQPAFDTDSSHAMFLTVYADGRQEMQVLPVQGDAVNAFAGDHPGWRLDSKMTWLIQMPVYVRDLSVAAETAGHASV